MCNLEYAMPSFFFRGYAYLSFVCVGFWHVTIIIIGVRQIVKYYPCLGKTASFLGPRSLGGYPTRSGNQTKMSLVVIGTLLYYSVRRKNIRSHGGMSGRTHRNHNLIIPRFCFAISLVFLLQI